MHRLSTTDARERRRQSTASSSSDWDGLLRDGHSNENSREIVSANSALVPPTRMSGTAAADGGASAEPAGVSTECAPAWGPSTSGRPLSWLEDEDSSSDDEPVIEGDELVRLPFSVLQTRFCNSSFLFLLARCNARQSAASHVKDGTLDLQAQYVFVEFPADYKVNNATYTFKVLIRPRPTRSHPWKSVSLIGLSHATSFRVCSLSLRLSTLGRTSTLTGRRL